MEDQIDGICMEEEHMYLCMSYKRNKINKLTEVYGEYPVATSDGKIRNKKKTK